MPRQQTNIGISNLSVTIPRRVHRSARLRALRSGAPNLAAYVAVILQDAAEQLTPAQQLEALMIELELKASRTERRHRS